MHLHERAEGSIHKRVKMREPGKSTRTFAVDPLGIDVGVRGLVECDFVGAIDMFYFEKAVAAASPVGV